VQSHRTRGRLYHEAVHQALTVLWEASDRICGKRLRVLIPVLIDAMERHGHLALDPVVRSRLLDVSAATIDRLLGFRDRMDALRILIDLVGPLKLPLDAPSAEQFRAAAAAAESEGQVPSLEDG
jgi:hypothetical protein